MACHEGGLGDHTFDEGNLGGAERWVAFIPCNKGNPHNLILDHHRHRQQGDVAQQFAQRRCKELRGARVVEQEVVFFPEEPFQEGNLVRRHRHLPKQGEIAGRQAAAPGRGKVPPLAIKKVNNRPTAVHRLFQQAGEVMHDRVHISQLGKLLRCLEDVDEFFRHSTFSILLY